MHTDDADDLVLFHDVRVIRSTAPALYCRVGAKTVWLPRRHISGRLWCRGDRGELRIRRWLARDRYLIDLDGVAIAPPGRVSRLPSPLHMVRGRPQAPRGVRVTSTSIRPSPTDA
jgi:hypothetical protein